MLVAGVNMWLLCRTSCTKAFGFEVHPTEAAEDFALTALSHVKLPPALIAP